MTRPACNCEGIQILGELEPGHTNECAVARWMVEEAPFAWRCERCGVLGGLYFADTEREAMADGLQHHRDKHGPAILVGPNPHTMERCQNRYSEDTICGLPMPCAYHEPAGADSGPIREARDG